MNILDHCKLSVRKFGGIEEDYYPVHKFMDSSKLFYFHIKHRMLLHNLYGIELAIRHLGEYLKNAAGEKILVRDIAAEHCKEDLSGNIPSLNDWLQENNDKLSNLIILPAFNDAELEAFVYMPFLRSNLRSSLLITCSNFGVYLAGLFFGFEKARALSLSLNADQTVANYLKDFTFTHQWQFTPDKDELLWLKNRKNGIEKTT